MKAYTPLLLTVLLWASLAISTGYGQAAKTIHQTIALDPGTEKININLKGKKIEIKETRSTRIMIETTIKISLPDSRLLDFLVNQGRYDLLKTFDKSTNELTLASPDDGGAIFIRGEECYSELSYVIYVPAAIQYINNSTQIDLQKEE